MCINLQVWDFVLLRDDTRLVSGSSDAELRVWSLHFNEKCKIKDDGLPGEPPDKKIMFDEVGALSDVKEEEEFTDDAVSTHIQ